MRYSRKNAGVLSLLLLFNSIGMVACGRTAVETGHASYSSISNISSISSNAGMESTPVINDTLPVLPPDVLVDQQGYASGREKLAVVKSREPVENFRLIDKETGETVYHGKVENSDYNEDLQLYISRVDFTEFTQSGTFYLECDRVGQSFVFTVQQDHYEELLDSLCAKVHEDCENRRITEEEILTVLTACEWYPETFADDNANEIPDLLEDIAKWLEKMTNDTGQPEPENMAYVAALAKFGYLYQKYDVQYATQCLQHASSVYANLTAASGRDAQKFMALTELYRAAGSYSYRTQILEYKDFFKDNTSYLEEPDYLYGAMTYMATRQVVDVDLCTVFMEDIRNRGEELAKRSDKMIDAVTSVNNGTEDLLKRAEELSCANYILYSYQYTEILEDFLHYLMGRNKDSTCYYPEEGDTAEYLLLIAQQVSLSGKHEQIK